MIFSRSRCLSALFVAALFASSSCAGDKISAGSGRMAPPAPRIALPVTSEMGKAVEGKVEEPVSGFIYEWKIKHRSLPGGAVTAYGPRASFTPGDLGTASFICMALSEAGLRSAATLAQVRIHPILAPGGFSMAGHLGELRVGMAVVALDSDHLLVTGGSPYPDGPGSRSAEIYIPSQKASWPTHAMACGRAGHAIANLGQGLFLVSGGNPSPSLGSRSEIFDRGSGLFSPGPLLSHGRTGHSATYLPFPQSVLLVGGQTTAFTPSPILERVLAGNHAILTGPPATLAPGHSATRLCDGKVLLVSHVEPKPGPWHPWAALFDPATNSLRLTSGQPKHPREGHKAILLVHPPRVLILGGRTPQGPCGDAEWYDPATETFEPCRESMLTAREDFGAALLPNGQVLILGGGTLGGATTATAERFEPKSQAFAPTSSLNHPRREPAVVSLPSGKVVVLGGSNEKEGCLTSVEAYDLIQGSNLQEPWVPLTGPSPGESRPWAPLVEPEAW